MHRYAVVALIFSCTALGFTPVARAQLSLTGDFDHGSLASWNGTTSAINLTGRTNYFGEWRWMYFKATGVQNASPTFTINQNFAQDGTPGRHELQEHEFVYSYDQEHWNFFDNNALLQQSTDRFRFSNSTPFTSNTVWIAYAIPYSYGKSVAHTQQVLASPWAEPTHSANGNASGIIGQTRAGTDDVGRSIAAQNLYAYRISDPSTDGQFVKKKVGLSTGLHAGETLGTYTYEGLVNWLISADPRAAELRKKAEFFCYPVLNPSGRFAGMSRTTVANPNTDPNGLWNENTWNTNAAQDIRISGQAMLADVKATPDNGGLDAFIDFHSTVPDYANPAGKPNDFGFVDAADSNTDWWLEVQRLMGGNLIEYTTSGSGNFTSTGYARRVLGADVEITVETQFTWERNIDYYHNLGEQFGIAFYNSWVPEPSSAVLMLVAGAALLSRRCDRRRSSNCGSS